jgi:hypothetical protein
MKKTQFYTLLAAGILGAMSLVGNVWAEDARTGRTDSTTTRPRDGAQLQLESHAMSPELQRAIEAGDAAQTSALMTKLGLTAKPGQLPRHECGTTQCTCSGALGCSTIAAACKPDTLNCNTEQCMCTKK